MDSRELMSYAVEAMSRSYSPYSGFRVGAALLTDDGQIYTGCNIENAAFTPTVCAERVAIFKAVSDGKTSFSKIAVAGGSSGSVKSFTYPCGVCRQVMREFCGGDFVIAVTDGTDIREHTLDEIMPYSFSPADLSRGNEK